MLSLNEVVDRYTTFAQQSGEPVPLSAFGLTPEETSRLFTTLDEDYHISRFLTFSTDQGPRYGVSGNAVTHIRIAPEVRSLF